MELTKEQIAECIVCSFPRSNELLEAIDQGIDSYGYKWVDDLLQIRDNTLEPFRRIVMSTDLNQDQAEREVDIEERLEQFEHVMQEIKVEDIDYMITKKEQELVKLRNLRRMLAPKVAKTYNRAPKVKDGSSITEKVIQCLKDEGDAMDIEEIALKLGVKAQAIRMVMVKNSDIFQKTTDGSYQLIEWIEEEVVA